MQIEPQPIPPPQAAPEAIVPAEKKLIAPIWHTAVLVVIMLTNSYFTARLLAAQRGAAAGTPQARIQGYLFTVGFELFLFFFVWLGLWLKKASMRELIGGRWNSPEDFLIDVGVAIGFWVVSAAILLGLAYVLGQANAAAINDTKQRLGTLIPQSGRELSIFVSLSIIAGFVEEILFRGYLQRQFGAIAGNIWIGLIVSALIFGGGHGYEGTKNMIRIAVYGALFGVLALWRKSLRPGMIAHALQDSISGVALYVMNQKGMF